MGKEKESKVQRPRNVRMVGHDEIVNGMVRVSLVEKVTFKQSFEKGKGGYIGKTIPGRGSSGANAIGEIVPVVEECWAGSCAWCRLIKESSGL